MTAYPLSLIDPRGKGRLWGHEGQFAPPRLSGRFALSEETFAGMGGNEKHA
jgi:hypothetical protein